MTARWIVAYDVADPKRLRQIAKHLECVGTRLQYSVFECGTHTWRDGKLRNTLAAYLTLTEDALSCYPQCPACLAASTWQGRTDTTLRTRPAGQSTAMAAALAQALAQQPAPSSPAGFMDSLTPVTPVTPPAQRAQRLLPPPYWLV